MPDVFLKTVSSEKYQYELAMSLAGHQLSIEKSSFSSPKIVSKNNETYTIGYEFIRNVSDFRIFYKNNIKHNINSHQFRKLIEVTNMIGKAIGTIHSNQKTFNQIDKTTSTAFEFEQIFIDDSVYLHGDFTPKNILYNEKDDIIHIIDWSSSALLTKPMNYGPRYWDLSFFISQLFLYSYSTLFTYSKKIKLADSFFSAYANECIIDPGTIKNMFGQFVLKYNTYLLFQDSSNKSMLFNKIKSHSETMLNKYAKNLTK